MSVAHRPPALSPAANSVVEVPEDVANAWQLLIDFTKREARGTAQELRQTREARGELRDALLVSSRPGIAKEHIIGTAWVQPPPLHHVGLAVFPFGR